MRPPARRRLTHREEPRRGARRRDRLVDPVVQGRHPRRRRPARSCASGRAPHPDGTEVDPAGLVARRCRTPSRMRAASTTSPPSPSAASSTAWSPSTTHGEVVRDALLWNDTRSADAAPRPDRRTRRRGRPGRARAPGPTRSDRSRSRRSPSPSCAGWPSTNREHAARVAAVALPHDWLTWRLAGATRHSTRSRTDRSDASGTGYWSPQTEDYRRDLLVRALGHDAAPAARRRPAERRRDRVGQAVPGLGGDVMLGAGAGDNAAAALGLGLVPGDVVGLDRHLGGRLRGRRRRRPPTPSGMVAGFADATGHYLPLACTLNASRVLDAAARLLGVDHDELSRLALSAPPGADGLVLVPYLEGERTPNRPDDTGALHGLRPDNLTPANLARAAVEGMLCGLADGLDALRRHGVDGRARAPDRRRRAVRGGAADRARRPRRRPSRSPRRASTSRTAPPARPHGRGRGRPSPPAWTARGETRRFEARGGAPFVRERYAEVRELTARRWDRG